jgi:hypothetical protein
MLSGMDAVRWVTLGIALWGAILSTFSWVKEFKKRRRVRLDVSVERITDPETYDVNDAIVITADNLGQEPITIKDLGWSTRAGNSPSTSKKLSSSR